MLVDRTWHDRPPGRNCLGNEMTSAIEHLTTRRSILAQFLGSPGPDTRQLADILTAAIRVPDHGKLTPWRFIRFAGVHREEAGRLLLQIRLDRGEALGEEESAAELSRFTRAPLVIAVVSCAAPHVKIPEWEQHLSAGAVCMNLLNAAHALGFAAQWLTDWPAYDQVAMRALGLVEGERFAGFIHIGTPTVAARERPRPSPADLTSDWSP